MNNKNIHTRTILSLTMLLSVLPLTILVLILFYYTIRQNTQRELSIIQNAENTAVKSITNDINVVETAASLCSRQMDFLVFSNSSDRKKLYLSGSEIIKFLKDKYSLHPGIAAVFLYNSSCDYIYPYYFYNASPKLRRYASGAITADTSQSGCWNTVTIDEEPFLFYQIQSKYGLMTVAMNPNRNYDYKNIAASDSLSLYMVDSSQLAAEGSGSIITTQIPGVSLSVAYNSLSSNPLRNIDLFQMVMLCLIIVFIVLIPVLWFYVQRLLLTPITQLNELFHQIRNNHPDSRVPVDSSIVELRSFAENFNEMLDSIDALSRKVYEQKLDVTRARLQYLQLQIRPHFYLNCLKNMYSQLSMKNYDKIGKMILALSAYFSQAFRDVHNFVSLKDELEACQSYIELQNVLERDITFTVDIDGRCVGAACSPMTVVTFVENSIKHSANDSSLTITVTARLLQEKDAGDTLNITIKNNGAFSAEALSELNSADPSEMVYKHEKIGISNIRYRLWLLYREKAAVTFANEDGWAVVNIHMPFEH